MGLRDSTPRKISSEYRGGDHIVNCSECGIVHKSKQKQVSINQLFHHILSHNDERMLQMIEKIEDLEERLDRADIPLLP